MMDYLSDPERVFAVCVHGFFALLIILFIFALNREGIPAGFRVAPSSAKEWLVYYFHTVEAVTVAGCYYIGAVHQSPHTQIITVLVLSSFCLLILSSLAVWPWDRQLCYRELVFCLCLLLSVGLMFPSVMIEKQA